MRVFLFFALWAGSVRLQFGGPFLHHVPQFLFSYVGYVASLETLDCACAWRRGSVCVCVWEREREREREKEKGWEREREQFTRECVLPFSPSIWPLCLQMYPGMCLSHSRRSGGVLLKLPRLIKIVLYQPKCHPILSYVPTLLPTKCVNLVLSDATTRHTHSFNTYLCLCADLG